MKAFDDLLEIMHRLRAECPWDKEQTLESLRKYLLEEAYECVGAMDELAEKGPNPLIEELGDVLLQIVFQAEILSEELRSPAISMIIEGICEKLVRRHPHVFGDAVAKDATMVLKRWDEIKKIEKGGAQQSHLDGISKALTSLQLAEKLGDRSKKVKFDWNTPAEVMHQARLEWDELLEAKTQSEKEHEIGDVLFSLVQWARHEKIDAETALAKANRRFTKRFKKMEELAKARGLSFESIPLPGKEDLWNEAKQSVEA